MQDGEKQETFSLLLHESKPIIHNWREEGFQTSTFTPRAPYLHLLYLQPHILQLLFPSTELADPLMRM